MYTTNKTRLLRNVKLVNEETADLRLWHVNHFIILLCIYSIRDGRLEMFGVPELDVPLPSALQLFWSSLWKNKTKLYLALFILLEIKLTKL